MGAEEAIIAIVRSIVAAWNRHDMDAFANLFAEDADFVNVRGVRWIGRHAIREAHAASHATIFKSSQLSLRETSVRFIHPDISVTRSVTEVSGQVNASGDILPPRAAMLTLVMMKQKGQWMIFVGQNTDIVAISR